MDAPAADNASGGLAEYIARVRMFSRNARLYALHVIGMDMIHGTWSVLFNLYLLAIGFDIEFIGLRLIIGGIAGAVTSLPAGIVADRIGRKAAFILGDGVGATLGLISITTTNEAVLLTTPALGAFFGALHEVSEPPFMHENSRSAERVHLFSVSESLRTGSAMVGSLLAGLLPLWAATHFGKVEVYRAATFIGLALWFASLIPALMLREEPQDEPKAARSGPGWRRFFSGVEHPGRIAQLVAASAVVSLGAGMTIPLFNVFFSEGLHAHEAAIGTTFALGQGFLALGALMAPFLAARMSKVAAVCLSRTMSVPFILLMALGASGGEHAGWALPVVGAAWVARTTLYNLATPIASAFSMEVLSLRERATMAGLEAAAGSGLMAAGVFMGSRLMAAGDYTTPFLAMAALYMASVGLYWSFFRRTEQLLTPLARPSTVAP